MKYEKDYIIVLYERLRSYDNPKFISKNFLSSNIEPYIEGLDCINKIYKSRQDAERALIESGLKKSIDEECNVYEIPEIIVDIIESESPVREDNDLGDGCYIDEDTGYLYNEDEDQYYDDDGVPVDPNDIF